MKLVNQKINNRQNKLSIKLLLIITNLIKFQNKNNFKFNNLY